MNIFKSNMTGDQFVMGDGTMCSNIVVVGVRVISRAKNTQVVGFFLHGILQTLPLLQATEDYRPGSFVLV
jgi:hypothetical protein